ncbi:MAG: nuclear transport factor 2 family protein [Pyrinomonadaceae bacterium]
METQTAKSLTDLVAAKVEMMKKGQVVEATEQFFAPDAKTHDFTGVATNNRDEMVEKMKGFTSGIKAVNGITHHGSAVSGDTSFMEFTFDFDMSDGSKILWHEIIRSSWKDGKIVSEQFFQA